jgi:hypothetical protein
MRERAPLDGAWLEPSRHPPEPNDSNRPRVSLWKHNLDRVVVGYEHGWGLMRVFNSRYTPGLKPGDGEKVSWDIGETVLIISGQDEGRRFVVTSEGMKHDACPGEFVREGYFEDDPRKTAWAKREKQLWFAPEAQGARAAGMDELGLSEREAE